MQAPGPVRSAMSMIRFEGVTPTIANRTWVAPTATLIGDVRVMGGSSIWYACVLRADADRICIGQHTNVQDGCVIHADPDLPVTVGSRVSVGHRAILHGCTIEDDVLVGMGATILNGARIESGSIIAAGAVVLENDAIPPNSLVAGVPARIRRETTKVERAGIAKNAYDYEQLAGQHAQAVLLDSAERW